jgi:hypothetical protein
MISRPPSQLLHARPWESSVTVHLNKSTSSLWSCKVEVTVDPKCGKPQVAPEQPLHARDRESMLIKQGACRILLFSLLSTTYRSYFLTCRILLFFLLSTSYRSYFLTSNAAEAMSVLSMLLMWCSKVRTFSWTWSLEHIGLLTCPSETTKESEGSWWS